jgi:hypothetical protein
LLYKQLYCPFIISIILYLHLSTSNKGYRSCSLAIISTNRPKISPFFVKRNLHMYTY